MQIEKRLMNLEERLLPPAHPPATTEQIVELALVEEEFAALSESYEKNQGFIKDQGIRWGQLARRRMFLRHVTSPPGPLFSSFADALTAARKQREQIAQNEREVKK